MKPVVVWFRRDLRIDDNPALFAASRTGAPVVPLFILDTDLIDGKLPSDGAAFDFQAESLEDLDRSLEQLGGRLICRKGSPVDVHRRLIEEIEPAALYYNLDYDPASRTRDDAVERLWRESGLEVRPSHDIVQHAPDEVLTGSGKPYVVFTPYSRKWRQMPKESPLGKPDRFTTPSLDAAPVARSVDLNRERLITEPVVRGGETEAQLAWRRFRKRRLYTYDRDRNFPGTEATSVLSPYLRFGCISVRRMLDDLAGINVGTSADRAGIDRYTDQLIWREFYIAVLHHFPHLRTRNFREKFDRFGWETDERMLESWKNGMTGYPLVDAGMRQLRQSGWMHNRVRMVVASFLTKDLMIDWRKGEAWFEKLLLDCEPASNNGGWQWAASTGVDPKPLRVFNPVLQSRRFDPEGTYISRWVPELKAVPVRFLHTPWEMTPALQEETSFRIGRDYPYPIVDHKSAAQRFKEAYTAVRLPATI